MAGTTRIGHRGACGYEPENTLASFQRAIDMGCTWIELDVHFVDNELIVIVSPFPKRLPLIVHCTKAAFPPFVMIAEKSTVSEAQIVVSEAVISIDGVTF